jgi:hypothetical protein
MKSLLISLLLLFTIGLQSQQSPSAIASSIAPANASTAYKEKWTAFHNPAILSSEKSLHISVNYENRFQVKELSTKELGVAIPNKHVDLGIAISHFGYSQYNEMQAGIGLARSFSSKFTMGVQFNYYSVYLSSEAGSKGVIVAQVGILSEVLPKLFVGFHAFNPAQTTIKTGITEKRIPSLFSLGTSYFFCDNLIWLAQIDKEVDSDLQWKTGFEYQLINSFCIRMGGYGNPFVPSLGVGFIIKQLQLDINFEKHPTLGINSVCGLSYTFK